MDGSRAGRERKKTVSFSSSLSEKKISSAADCIHSMVEGSELKKIRPNSRVYQRYYLLDAGLQALCWEPSKKESDKARISLASIREVRTGRNTETFRTSGVYEQISEDLANIWVTGLRYLMQYGKHALDMLASSQDSLRLGWLEQLFSSAADSDRQEDVEEGIRLQSAIKLIQTVNPGVSSGKVEHRFKELQRVRERMCGLTLDNGSGVKDHIETKRLTGRNERVTKQEFIEVFHDFCTRPEIYFLLVQFSSNKEFLDTKDLMRFLEAEQGMAHVSEETSLKLIQSHEPSLEGRQQGYLSLDGFTSYLTSAECHLFDREHDTVCQDMSQPLSHYYINSSHNTYLIEDQFRGPSDISGYIRALKMGCRCVEVDVWDGPDEEPVVCTGHTLSPPLALRCVLEAIGRFAFVASEYPLIICIENHCSLRQQKVMLQHLVGILGDRLYTNPPDEGDPYLPSPHALRHRILLKGKKLGPSSDGEDGEVSEEDEGAEMCQRIKAANSGGAGPGRNEKDMLQKSVTFTAITQSNPPHLPPKRFQLLKELSNLVNLCHSVQFIDFPTSSTSQKPWELCSFHESLAVRLAGESPGDFVNHNKHFLSRVYPSPMRIDSSNMNPQDLWKCGCQIVSMNFQTAGLMMDLNTAWFRQNGNCGYVLRPAIMRQEVSYFSADTRDTVPGVSPQLLHVKVISGQNLPKPRGSEAKGDVVDPYVYVEIHGIPADCTERRTRTVTQNGDNPIFDESFEFQINLPELAMVRFVVLDDDFIGDEFIGQYTISLECLQPGYRHVPLQCLTGEELPHAKLFVHVALTNRRGGGKPHKRGLSVRKARKGRDYTALRDLGVRAVDEVFKMAAPLLREATDLRENMQNSVAVFRELCGVSAVANLMQCVLALSSRVSGPDGTPLLLFDLQDHYPTLEPQGPLPDVLRRVVSTYEMMVQASKVVMELSDGIYDRILHIQTTAMEFHEKLQSLAAKEGLKGRKVSRALESFSWNITILKGQADLLQHAKAEVQENMKQVHDAALTGNLTKKSVGVTRVRSQTRRGQDDRHATSPRGPSA
ncbi:inactive phospholipase C-like protein 2 [Lates japonicus]|uniref:Phosphoinositide phospholipase C n=1 Tax=Lates japonicus TaxID=270547 RepID=A0AAD3NPY7_LATJO|nr:inactive phospholipase C-like protein 2 [Lates japonicus]